MDTATGVVVAGGTGYYYPPYYAYPAYGYPAYYPYPVTYGAVPYYNSATGAYGVSQTAYGPYGSATRTASYNPYTGTYARTASATTSYGSAALGQAYNPYTGTYAATKQGSNAYAQWGSSVVSKGGETAYTQHYSTSQGTVGSVQTSSGGKAAGVTTASGSTAVGKTASGNMYAGHDGNVYKNTGSGWEKYDNGSWNPVQKPTTPTSTTQQKPPSGQAGSMQQATGRSFGDADLQKYGGQSSAASREAPSQQAQQHSSSFEHPAGSSQMESLQREAQNRERGAQQSERFQQFQHSGGGERSWGGGGGFRGGGGRGLR
jgi:hypothetical protein